MASLFSKIIEGDISSYKIKEDDRFLAFLDIRPISVGHTLVIPKLEIDHFYDLPDDILGDLFLFAKPVVKAIEAVVDCHRVGSIIAGLEVPHAHLHLVPIISMETFSFSHAKQATEDELQEVQQKILMVL